MSSYKSCCWSITINNPTEEDHQQWASLKTLPWVREVSGQLEQPEGGTLHIQGMVKTASVRFAAMKKALPRAHIEAAKNPIGLARYVGKDDTRVGEIPTVRVATATDLQHTLLGLVLNDLYHLTKKDPLSTDESQMIFENEAHLQKHWEYYLDKAVSALIRQGYYGVEFVVSNPQVRTAYKKYLPAIMYRAYNQSISKT